MKKIFITSFLSLAALSAAAQTAYDAGNLSQSDLIGSARYVGMGGALNALGADLSLMGENPAGTGLYRKSDVGFTASNLITANEGQLGYESSKLSFDQAGVLFAFQVDNSGSGIQFVNFGVNYKKNRNFFGNNAVDVAHLDNTFSQTYQIADLANDCAYYQPTMWGLLPDMAASSERHDGILYEDEKHNYYGIAAQNANYKRSSYGNNIEADVNVSLNVSDRFYYGLSVGIYDMNYSGESFYTELGVDKSFYDFTNWHRISGTGVDLKFGFICRPIEDSPFRFGVSVKTPTWYNLSEANGTTLYFNDAYLYEGDSDGDYSYKFRSPAKFNLSFGHTIANKVALGFEYEFANFGASHYNAYSYEDKLYISDINKECIKNTLKAQNTIKLGVEYKPIDCLSLRAGYNYLTSAYEKDAFKTILYFEPFTETDFTNWGGIHRACFGLGYRWKSGYVDMAYQYQTQKGDFYAFDDIDLKPTEIKENRSSIIATLGFRF